jgi:hypothetical protein
MEASRKDAVKRLAHSFRILQNVWTTEPVPASANASARLGAA